MNLLLALAVAGMSPQGASGDTLDNHPELKLALSQSQRQIQSVHGSFSGEQPGRYQFGLAPSGRLTVGDLSIRTVSFGNGENAVATVRPSSALGKDGLGYSKLTFKRAGISEWYVNEAEGLHHWFRVDKKVGDGNLWVKLASAGAKGIQVSDEKIDFSTSQGNLSYAGLKVWDATGKQLPASMQLRGSEIVIGVEDAEAEYPVTIDPTWTEEAILSASDKSEGAYFGGSVSVSGDTAVIGASQADPSGVINAGAAYVFTRNGSTWSEQAILSASDKSESANFGWSVSVSGDTAVIGAHYADPGGTNNAGAAYVFTRSGTTWSQQAILSASDKSASALFGVSVSLSGDTAIIGAPYATLAGTRDAGEAYVFTRNGSIWSQQAILSASDKAQYSYFGISASVSGDTAIISAPYATPSGFQNAGKAYVFTRNSGTWSEQQILTASDKSAGALLGQSVSMSGDTAVITAPSANSGGLFWAGQAYVFTRNGNTWSEQAILSASDKSEFARFGSAVSVSGDTAVITAPSADSGGTYLAGQAYVFTRNGNIWSQQAILSASDKSEFAQFGDSVSVSGDTAVITAPYATSGALSSAGQAYVYRTPSSLQASVSFGVAGVSGGKSIIGTVTLASAPSANTVLTLSSDNVALSVPASVIIAAGSTNAQFTATSSVVTSDTLVTVTASGTGITAGSGQITVRTPRVSGVTFNADNITAGETVTGTVNLQSAAPAGGLLVTLVNSDSTSLDCPSSVTVPAGQTKATFPVTGKSVASPTLVKVEGTPSFNEKSDTITVNPSSIYITELYTSDFILGTITFGTVRLSSPAPAGGYVVTLASLTTGLSVPATATVPEGETFANFLVDSTRALQNGTIRATFQGSTKTDLVSVTYNAITTVTASASTITVGQDSMITVTLNAPIPLDARLVVDVTSQKAGVLSIPSTKFTAISGGASSVTFPVTGLQPGVTNLYVKILNHGVKSVKITVTNP